MGFSMNTDSIGAGFTPGTLFHGPASDGAVATPTRQCSIGTNAKDLATMAATLAAMGKNPVTGKQVMDAKYVPGVLAVMATAGLYDATANASRTSLEASPGSTLLVLECC